MLPFFQQLDLFSQRYFHLLKITEVQTPWRPNGYEEDTPRGAILHYTADDDIERVVRWFMQEKWKAKAAAHVVVADRRLPSCEDLLEDLPLVQELPVTIVQCCPPDRPTWHATWASHWAYGIEAINVGEVRQAGDGFVCHWRRNHAVDEPEWTMPWAHPTKAAVAGWSRWWEPYTINQVRAIIMLLRQVRAQFPGLDQRYVVGHECVQGVDTMGAKTDKRDPGPLLPIRDIRECVFGGKVSDPPAEWLRAFEQRPDYCAIQRETLVRGWAALEAGTLPDLPEADVAWLRFNAKMNALAQQSIPFLPAGALALALLGYHVPQIVTEMTDDVRASVRLFQRLAGLKVDGVPGPLTRAALEARLYNRGILRNAGS